MNFCCHLVTQLCLTLCNPMDCSLLGSSVHGIFQVRILEWVAVYFSRGSSGPRNRTHIFCKSPALADRFFTTEPPGKPHHLPRTWVVSQAPLFRSHSENTETQAVTWHLTKECLHSTLDLCSCNEVSFHFWAALYSRSQRDITSCRNQKWIHAQHCPPPRPAPRHRHSFWRRQVLLLHLTTKMPTKLRNGLNAKFF